MTPTQKKVLWALILIGAVYFALMGIPNARGARTTAMLAATSTDEPVLYPDVVRMLSLGSTWKQTLSNIIYIGDYHYGYPFYFFSALALLPVRILYGERYVLHTQLNLWLLRQLISLLPMILSAGVLVYLQTRFRSMLSSIALFLFLLTTRSVFRNGVQWWHPDALAILAAVLTLFFLDRDRLRLGRNFTLAAVACGLATSIKLIGVFFAFAVLAYLAAALIQRKAGFRRAVSAGGLFVLVMAAVVVVSNPFLINAHERQTLVNIQLEKSSILSSGYGTEDPSLYQKDPAGWDWTLRTWFASWAFLGFLLLSLAAACLWGGNTFLNRLILLWVVPYSIYLFYFVAVKPDHYFLPAMLPLFSAALALPAVVHGFLERIKLSPARRIWIQRGVAALVAVLLVGQVTVNLTRYYSGNITVYQQAVQVENRAGG